MKLISLLEWSAIFAAASAFAADHFPEVSPHVRWEFAKTITIAAARGNQPGRGLN